MSAESQAPEVTVVLIRHAQSQWNLENRFTGWANPPLTATGLEEACRAGVSLREAGYRFDAAFSSRLLRAEMTLDILLDKLGQANIPRRHDWRLNERHYGILQGMDKTEASTRFGAAQVQRWRRGYLDRAGAIPVEDPRHPRHQNRYADVAVADLPGVESLAETRGRVMHFWEQDILPRIQQGQCLLISSHGNTLRALLMSLSNLSISEVEALEIPTATPIEFRFDRQGKALDWRYLRVRDKQLCA